MITVKANARSASYDSDDLITSGSAGIPCEFVLSSDFNGLSPIAVFEGSGTARDVALMGNTCVVPHEVLATAGGYLRIGIYASNSEGTIVIPTVWAGSKMILQGTKPSEVDPSEPTPSWAAQVQEAAAEALANSEDAIEIAGGADAAAEEARHSASAAAASATAAGQSASAAGTAQEAAESAQMAAASARDAAVAAQGSAESSAQTAAGSATAAAGSAAAAAASEAAAREVEESIPADYTDLSNDVIDLKSQTNSMPRILDSDALGVDLDIADKDGYVLVRLKDGHIETKNFKSKDFSALKINQMPYVADSTANGIDLDVADREGYVLLRLKDGHIETKAFDSRDVVGMFAANNTDVGKILKVKTVSNGKVTDWEFAETAGTDDDLIINIPAKLYATEGIECNIYFENLCDNWERYNWDVTCTKGMQLERGYRITPVAADAGQYTITVKATRIDNPGLYKEVSSTLIVSAENAGTGNTVKMIVLGDSTTANGIAVTKIHSDIDDTGMTIETLGTRGTSPNNHEGRSGWRFWTYFSESSSELTNPFYNPTTQTFDAGYYFTNTGIDVPDWFIINLGINDLFGAASDADANTAIESVVGYADAMIDSILSVSQDIKVGLCLTIPPNHSQDAFGKGYGCGQTRDRYKRNNVMLVDRFIAEYGNKESERIYLVPINTALDTVYNMSLETIPVNARNSTITYSSPTGNGGVHPAEPGYWQIADVYTAFIKGNV